MTMDDKNKYIEKYINDMALEINIKLLMKIKFLKHQIILKIPKMIQIKK